MGNVKSYRLYTKIGMRRHPEPHMITYENLGLNDKPSYDWKEIHNQCIRDIYGIKPNLVPKIKL